MPVLIMIVFAYLRHPELLLTPHRLFWFVIACFTVMVVLAIIGRRQYPWTHADTDANDGPPHDPYWYHVLVALDCFANALLGGMIGETISSRCGRWALAVDGHGTVWHWLARFMVRWLGVIQPDHGQHAIAGALGRATQLALITQQALVKIERQNEQSTIPPAPRSAA